MFDQSLSDKSDKFSDALKKVENAKGKYQPKDPKWLSLKTDLKRACDELALVVTKYESTMNYLANNATNNAQKAACENARNFLLFTVSAGIMNARKLT